MLSKISIIIPIYNTKQYLIEAIDSLLTQKPFIKEIILVNDGSTDGSKELIDKNYSNNKLFKIIHSENNGQGHARNLGLEIATGEFIYFFDSDDIVTPNLFEEFHTKLGEYPNLHLFCFSGQSFLSDDNSVEKTLQQSLIAENAYKRNCEKYFATGEDAFNHLVKIKSFFPGPPLYIVQKELLEKYDLKFLSIRYEDEEFSHRLFLMAGQIYVTNRILFNRRVRHGSTMQLKRSFKDFLGYFTLLQTLAKLKDNKLLSSKTIDTLNQRIKTFVRIVIQTKEFSKIKLTNEEKKIFKSRLSPFLSMDFSLYIYYFSFPLELRLRELKTFLFKK